MHLNYTFDPLVRCAGKISSQGGQTLQPILTPQSASAAVTFPTQACAISIIVSVKVYEPACVCVQTCMCVRVHPICMYMYSPK